MRMFISTLTAISIFIFFAGVNLVYTQDLELTIDILEPSEQPGNISPGLQYLEDKISRSPLKYQNYMELASSFRSIPLGDTDTISFNLRQNIKLQITSQAIEEHVVKFLLKLWSDGNLLLETDLSLVRLGTVMIASPGNPDLIIAISEGF